MRIQDTLSNCCEGIKDFAASAANWIGRTVSQIGTFLADTVAKVAQFVKPHFERAKTFIQENKESVLVAGIAFVVGAIVTTVVNQFFCSSNQQQPPAPAPAPNPAP